MLRNYLITALRNLIRNRLYAAINIAGLAVGFAAALLIALYVRDEFSFDTWVPGHARTYLLGETLTLPGKAPWRHGSSSHELGAWLRADFPEIEEIARIAAEHPAVRRGDFEANEQLYWADPGLFTVLPLPFLAGDPRTALDAPDGIVITRRIARKYFGEDLPLGKTLEINRTVTLRVTGILADLPSNTHLDTEIFASNRSSASWMNQRDALPAPLANGSHNADVRTYLRLRAGVSAQALEEALTGFLARHAAPASFALSFWITPIAAIHLDPAASIDGGAMRYGEAPPSGDIDTVYALSAVAILIVAVALMNFINLATARATRRMVEIGVRKVSGAQRRDLMIQLLGESLAYGLLGLILAALLAEGALPALDALVGRQITFGGGSDIALVLGFAAAIAASSILAGIYPAVILSASRLGAVLKSGRLKGTGSARGRQGMVASQFAVLIGLLVAIGAIYGQVTFAVGHALKFDKDQVLVITSGCRNGIDEAIRLLPGVNAAACSSMTPSERSGWEDLVTAPDGARVTLAHAPVGLDYFAVYGVQAIAGRLPTTDRVADAFPRDVNAPYRGGLILNETAVRALGFASPTEAIGQSLTIMRRNHPNHAPSDIIGVVPDFLTGSVRQTIEPTVFFVDPEAFNWVNVKLDADRVPQTLVAIDALWQRIGDPWPIHRYFLDQAIEALYASVTRQARLLGTFAAVTVFVATLGLFGLATFIAESRTKEIGIRKSMGATRGDILRLVLWQFTRPVLWANVIAWPVAYVIMHRWLEGFAYHINLQPWMFLTASALALLIAVATVIGHALLVARAKPVTALRYE